MNWLEILGWIGSAIVVWSLLQTRILRLRVLNLLGCTVSVVYATLGSLWPVLGLNFVLALINIYHLRKLTAHTATARAYAVVTVNPDDAYLQFLLTKHAADIAETSPHFSRDDEASEAHLVLHEDETVGVVLIRDEGDGTAHVLLDYVTPRFRDFTPGKYVFQDSGLLRSQGFSRVVVTTPTNPHTVKYYATLGFTSTGKTSTLQLG
ncbi:hypothetical protein [Timonella sp. A28]|uniref:hypothetical protein n=1 Tax=Timonella sp. A28 TaxID=3442640 RepID=UPI003EBEBB70